MRPPTSIQVPGSSTSATSSRAPKMSGVATACPFQCCCGGCGFAAAEEVGVEQDAGAAIIGGPLDHAQVPVGVEPDIVVQLERIQVIDAGEVDADVSLDDAKGAQVHCVGTDRGAEVVAGCGVPAPGSAKTAGGVGELGCGDGAQPCPESRPFGGGQPLGFAGAGQIEGGFADVVGPQSTAGDGALPRGGGDVVDDGCLPDTAERGEKPVTDGTPHKLDVGVREGSGLRDGQLHDTNVPTTIYKCQGAWRPSRNVRGECQARSMNDTLKRR